MRKKLIIGLILLIVGVLLQNISKNTDIWIIGVMGGIIWPIGLVMSANASIAHDKKKHDNLENLGKE